MGGEVGQMRGLSWMRQQRERQWGEVLDEGGGGVGGEQRRGKGRGSGGGGAKGACSRDERVSTLIHGCEAELC